MIVPYPLRKFQNKNMIYCKKSFEFYHNVVFRVLSQSFVPTYEIHLPSAFHVLSFLIDEVDLAVYEHLKNKAVKTSQPQALMWHNTGPLPGM